MDPPFFLGFSISYSVGSLILIETERAENGVKHVIFSKKDRTFSALYFELP